MDMDLRLFGCGVLCAVVALAAGGGWARAADSTTPPATSAPSTSEAPAPSLGSMPETTPNLTYSGAQTYVTISQTPTQTVEEASINGTLVWVKVTPRYGRPYYLIPTDGGNTFIRRDSLDTGLRVPNWVIFSW